MTYQNRTTANRLFGRAEVRPQALSYDLMLERRRLNYNDDTPVVPSEDYLRKVKDWRISQAQLKVSEEPPRPDPPIWVDDEPGFKKMIEELDKAKVIMMDCEGNDEDFRLGMICLIQIATRNKRFLVDPFKTFQLIETDLKEFMEKDDIVIVMHGCVNDILWLRRDFGIFPVCVIDTQLVYQAMHRGNLIAYDALMTNLLPQIQQPYQIASKKVLQAADWRARPLCANLLNYADFDVYFDVPRDECKCV